MQARYFLRLGSDDTENAKTIIEFATLQLQRKREQSDHALEAFGPEAMHTSRPWALIFTKNKTAFEGALQSMGRDMQAGTIQWRDRRWLEGIRVCNIESIHELKGVLCALHLSGKEGGADLLSWIRHEHDDQPPCLIVMMDLLRLLSARRGSDDCVDVQQDELCKILALLVETSNFLTARKRQLWDQGLGCNTGLTTDLLITDNKYLIDRPPAAQLPNDTRSRMAECLYRILEAYVDWLPIGGDDSS